ncbi:hypothetical protein C0Q70_20397 [Pomacea canaliculata]|uniref:Uncharacterized protein n=1 Tax=Pomacea canaliculata TaxID=400727 RepID=A0A2T7NFE6_POMCA|nr:hypothetical protein C0Q70_20397 [Pomacea canaliculata]
MERLKGRDMAAQRVLKQRMDALERQKMSSTSAHDQDIRDLKRDLETMQRRRSSSLQVSQKPLVSGERRISLTSSPHTNDVGAAPKNKEGE